MIWSSGGAAAQDNYTTDWTSTYTRVLLTAYYVVCWDIYEDKQSGSPQSQQQQPSPRTFQEEYVVVVVVIGEGVYWIEIASSGRDDIISNESIVSTVSQFILPQLTKTHTGWPVATNNKKYTQSSLEFMAYNLKDIKIIAISYKGDQRHLIRADPP